jgi:hypothetical protein
VQEGIKMKYVINLSGLSNRAIEFKTKEKKNGEKRLKLSYRNLGTENVVDETIPVATWQVNFNGKKYSGRISNPS